MIRPLRAIVLEARIDATPADVWHALTDGPSMADWFAPFVKGATGAGGVVELSWDGTNMWPTTIQVWNPEQHLQFADPGPPDADGAPGPRIVMDWFITSDAGKTLLRLVHSGFGPGGEWDDQIDGLTGGWTYFLWNLEICLTRHRGTHRTMVSARPRVTIQRDVFWDGLFTGGFISSMDPAAQAPTTCAITLGGRTLDAAVETNDPRARFAARIPALNDSLLFIEVEGKKPSDFHTGFWLSTYGLPAETVAELRGSLDAAVARLIEPEVAAAL
jgi:uncharacterized protein YndB with AHSA1/START domain